MLWLIIGLSQIGFATDFPDSSQMSWTEFKNRYQFKNIYVVFAGPYPSNPSSAYGHLFILTEPLEDRSLLLWDVFNFAAITDDVHPIKQFYGAFLSGLTGNCEMMPFYEKLREYTYIDSRALWLFPVKSTPTKNVAILKTLFQIHDKEFDYRFASENCASKVEYVVKTGLGVTAQQLAASPRSVLRNLEDYLDSPLYVESVEGVMKRLIQDVSLNDILASDSEKGVATASEAAIVLNLLEWQYYRRNRMLDPSETEKLNRLRVLVSNSENASMLDLKPFGKPFNIHSPIKYGIGVRGSERETPEYRLLFRLALHEFEDNADIFPKFDYISVAKLDAGLREGQFLLNEFWLFHQQSITPRTPLYRYKSWRLALGSERRFEMDSELLASGVYFGYGITESFFRGEKLALTAMMHLNPVYLEQSGFTLLLDPEVAASLFVSRGLKMRFIGGASKDPFRDSDVEPYLKGIMNIDYIKFLQLNITARYSQNGIAGGLNLGWYWD